MRTHGEAVPMVHYECYTCHMQATCVQTPSSDLAWLDHMENHGAKDNYGVWVWDVVPFEFGP
jgi:hypothetical protein